MNDDFEIIGDSAQEARIVAVVLGEASDFEREEVDRLCEENAELQIFRRRIEAVHGLIGKSRAENPESKSNKWTLSKERRARVLEKLGEKETVVAIPKKKPLVRPIVWQIAACAAVMVIVVGVLAPTQLRTVTLSHSEYSTDQATSQNEQSISYRDAGLTQLRAEREELKAEETLPSLAMKSESTGRRNTAQTVSRQPSAPSSAMAKVLAEASAEPTAIPVPEIEVPLKVTKYGESEVFGFGWQEGQELAEKDVNESAPQETGADAFAPRQSVTGTMGGFREEDPALGFGLVDAGGSSSKTVAGKNVKTPSNNVDVETRLLLEEGERSYSLGNYDESGTAFREVLKLEPFNKTARRWLERNEAIQADYYRAAYDHTRSQLLMETDAAWELTLPKTTQRTLDDDDLGSNLSELGEAEKSSSNQEAIVDKLQNIIIPQVDFKKTPLNEALEYLTQKTLELDSESSLSERGVNFVIENDANSSFYDNELNENQGRGLLLGDSVAEKEIDFLKLENVPLETALEYISIKTGMRYRVDDSGVTLLSIGSEGSANLVTRSWQISPEAYALLMEESEDNPFAAEQNEVSSEREALENSGISFIEGATVRYMPENGVLIVRNTVSNLDMTHQILAQLKERLLVSRETLAMDEKDAQTHGDSTFSLHVSDVSFKLAKSALEQGKWPEAVRVEEFVNAFSYYEQPLIPNEPVGLSMEQAAHPFLSQRNLLRMSLQTAATGRGAGVPLRLTVVLDKSGSMERVDRATAVEEAFRVLVEQLMPGDKVTLVGFSRRATLLADLVDGSEGERLLEILRKTPSEGGTNVEEALNLAFAKAAEHYQDNAQNRVILLTDGIANLGDAVPDSLMKIVTRMREEGLAFDACGVGVEGVNDKILEALTRKGDGRYYLLGSAAESGSDFAKQVAGALRPAARNVKVQVEWNPDRVGKWRLYGFENHELEKEDFRNDAVDAAEMAAEEEGVALYHVEVKPDGDGPLGVARVRFQDVASDEMVEREWEIAYEGEAAALDEADAKIRLAGVAGLAAEKLAQSALGERVDWDELLQTTRQLQSVFPKQQQVRDLESMIEQAKGLE